MIYTDDDGVINIEYGHGSVMGFSTEMSEDGFINYGFASTDPHKIGTPCENIDDLVGKMDNDAGISVRLRFNKLDSIEILLEDLQKIANRLRKLKGKL